MKLFRRGGATVMGETLPPGIALAGPAETEAIPDAAAAVLSKPGSCLMRSGDDNALVLLGILLLLMVPMSSTALGLTCMDGV